MRNIIVFLFIFLSAKDFAQHNTISTLDSGHKTSLRGMSVLNNNIIWASGSNGTVARSINGGKSFEWFTVKGFEQRDFRDVEAFDENTALIMAVAEPAIILKTKDGGQNWYKVFEDSTEGMFLDAMDFDKNIGCVIGDPIAQHLFRAFSFDFGENWIRQMSMNIDDTLTNGEAFFAASGTNIKIFTSKLLKKPAAFYVSGGTKANFFDNGTSDSLPIVQGKETTGANSIDVFNKDNMIVVGGDFVKDKDSTGNCAFTFDGGKTWRTPQIPPHGYRSCVIYISLTKLLTCGTSGVDISYDNGFTWQLISNQSFHVCQRAKTGNAVFLAGANGRIARFNP